MWSLLILFACNGKEPDDHDGYSPIDDTAPPTNDSGREDDGGGDEGGSGEPVVYDPRPGATLTCESATTEALLVLTPAAGTLDIEHAGAILGCCPTSFTVRLVQDDPAQRRLREELTLSEDLCDCACLLTARYSVGGLEAGRWTVSAGTQDVEVDVP